MELHALKKRKNRTMPSKRVGRGYGSGKGGHTCSFGQKGQKTRAGYSKKVGFEGGNVPLYRRIPKFRGFRNVTRVEYEPVNLSTLEQNYKAGETVSLKTLRDKGLIKKRTKNVKILAKGDLKKSLKFKDVEFSEAAFKRTHEKKAKKSK
ncbi:50S ribosomal protein L15 [Candidatus Dojkabacteria bacterium]|nr:50S ribosomal protein L15 [Candidatus Dojkabacteria bacterium]